MSAPAARLSLRPEPAAVPQARHFVRERLTHHGTDLQDAAEACISELVTNAVLHARTDVHVAVHELTGLVRLEVVDQSPAVPRRLVHTLRSATGRGMEIVTVLAESWGVDRVDGRSKAVWCTLSLAGPPPGRVALGPDELLESWPEDHDPLVGYWGSDPEPVLAPGADAEPPADRASDGASAVSEVVMVGYPVRLGIRARDHTSAILRECALVSQVGGAGSAPDGLVRLAEHITAAYSGELAAVERQRTRAYLEGASTVDLRYPLPPGGREVVVSWREAMALLDAYADGAALLTLATPPDLVELREWMLAEFVSQGDGGAPRPWTGPLD